MIYFMAPLEKSLANSVERWYIMSTKNNGNEVAKVADSIKESTEKYLSEMDTYVSKLERMSSEQKQQHAQESLKSAGILTKAGKLSTVYR